MNQVLLIKKKGGEEKEERRKLLNNLENWKGRELCYVISSIKKK